MLIFQEYKKFSTEIRNFYFGEDVRVTNETLAEYNDLVSDIFIVHGVDQSAKAHAKNSNGKTYYYRYATLYHLAYLCQHKYSSSIITEIII